MNSINSVTVIIRSVGERTEQLCKKLILEQKIPDKNVFTIRERPFSKAMKVSYQTGMDNDLPWTLCIDADVLLKHGAIHELLKVAENLPENVLGISGKLLDKFFGIERPAGNYLFQTKYLNHMINSILTYEVEDIRPESSIIKKLENDGLLFKRIPLTIGLHDFEQHYHDIARKAFIHANKHSHLLSELYSFWNHKRNNDPDFEAAIHGLSKGIISYGDIKINVNDFSKLYREIKENFSDKTESISDFKIKNSTHVADELNNSHNFYEVDLNLEKKLEKDFRNRIYDTEFHLIIKYIAGKVVGKMIRFKKDVRN